MPKSTLVTDLKIWLVISQYVLKVIMWPLLNFNFTCLYLLYKFPHISTNLQFWKSLKMPIFKSLLKHLHTTTHTNVSDLQNCKGFWPWPWTLGRFLNSLGSVFYSLKCLHSEALVFKSLALIVVWKLHLYIPCTANSTTVREIWHWAKNKIFMLHFDSVLTTSRLKTIWQLKINERLSKFRKKINIRMLHWIL